MPVVSRFSDPNDGRRPFEFDRDVGDRLPVIELSGIGPVRARRLNEIGIRNLSNFIEAGSETLARELGVSEVSVAEMQENARRRTLEGG